MMSALHSMVHGIRSVAALALVHKYSKYEQRKYDRYLSSRSIVPYHAYHSYQVATAVLCWIERPKSPSQILLLVPTYKQSIPLHNILYRLLLVSVKTYS